MHESNCDHGEIQESISSILLSAENCRIEMLEPHKLPFRITSSEEISSKQVLA